MGLAAWQERLQEHFADLRCRRSEAAGDEPVFALEHGLSDAELAELKAEILKESSSTGPVDGHWLPWVVYAAEVGYTYCGEEYWQTFEAETPGWIGFDNRYWMQQKYKMFRDAFGGVSPSGAWADHFSIICWPITHAVLPVDLQRQFARMLYEIRHSFRAELFESPGLLGERIAAHSVYAVSTRFDYLAQQPALVGQIAAALLLEEAQLQDSLLLPTTLRRIAEDLDRERLAREWMRDARRSAQRVEFRGLRKGRPREAPAAEPAEPREQDEPLCLEPNVVLQPTNESAWRPVVELPDLSPLLARFPAFQPILTGSRCYVAGSSGRPLARGRVLYGRQHVTLHEWPEPGTVMLRFEHPCRELEYVLATDCLLRPGPTWLFRIRADGLAQEVRCKAVRPAQSYMLLSASSPAQPSSFAKPVRLECDGVCGVRMDMPEAIPREWEEEIGALGLCQARSVRIWPAGLPAAYWDGEGRGEWLSSDRPCIGIRPDHDVDAVTLTLAEHEDPELTLSPVRGGRSLFVELPQLRPGPHILELTTHSDDPGLDEQKGYLDFVVRDPRGWSPRLAEGHAFQILVDPATPTLEQLWEGEARVEIRGPSMGCVICTVRLFERGATSPLVEKTMPGLRLPTDQASWERHFVEHFRDASDVQRAYDQAQSCQIDFIAGELGAYALSLERALVPLRWCVRRRGTGHTLRLLDNTGTGDPVVVQHYPFETPDVPGDVPQETAAAGIEVPRAGGMYVARVREHEQAIIMPPTIRDFSDMRSRANVHAREPSEEAAFELLDLLEVWSQARIPGNVFARDRQGSVLLSFREQILGVVCGATWLAAERRLRPREGARALRRLADSLTIRRDQIGVAVVIEREAGQLAEAPVSTRVVRLAHLIERFPLLSDGATAPLDVDTREHAVTGDADWMAEFALRLGSCPEGLRSWAEPNLRAGMEKLMAAPVVARAARFMILAVDSVSTPRPVAERWLHDGWEWE